MGTWRFPSRLRRRSSRHHCIGTPDHREGNPSNHAIFTIPNVYYGTYKGDIDDGSNKFKRWFWEHKITRSLHNNADEPWTEVCMQDIGENGSASITGNTPQRAYDALAATGVELVKMDFWDGSGECWYTNRDCSITPRCGPRASILRPRRTRPVLKASLYMGGTYQDCDLTTISGRDAELAAVLKRYDEGWFDMWRTDLYTAPKEPMPQTYDGVTNFLYIQDQLIKAGRATDMRTAAMGEVQGIRHLSKDDVLQP